MLTMQEALSRLTSYWAERGCLVTQPMNTEVGAGTLNPSTFLRVLGPEPWRVVYVEPSVRPDDSRYGENPNRLQTHTQLQVVLKPDPGNPQELYLGSLEALGIDVAAHDVRFVEDNWASPALGAWGLGWEVWLDGLEITQFTYFQQAGGQSLDPVSVEITYGVERILMALQGVTHFRDIAYAPGVSYGEVFGQAEYEMSRYYLDEADVARTRELLDIYAGEARRLIEEELPVPAHTFVLKCSQAFNVLDARGAVSTAERAAEFARMRRLATDVAALWIERRAELEHPLGVAGPLDPALAAPAREPGGDGPRMLVLEIGTEEMPPAEVRAARAYLRDELAAQLARTGLAHGDVRVHATPRRLVAVVPAVAAREEDHEQTVKGPRTGAPQQARAGFARAQGVPESDLEIDGEHLVVRKHVAGRAAIDLLGPLLARAVAGLPSGRAMRWNDPELTFTRPVRWLVALLGDDVVPVAVGALTAGRETRVLRTADRPVLRVASAETFMETISINGIVADPEDRRELIVSGAQELVYGEGTVDAVAESDLIDQVTQLVEQPTPLLGRFDERYLELPDAVLTTVMRKHQRYLPVRDDDGKLLPLFVTVANGPVDADLVRAGNEAVLRARYEDATFFYRADRQTPVNELLVRLRRLTFTDKLGSMADRAGRIAVIAGALSRDFSDISEIVAQAGRLVKFDLGSQLVTELTSLAGILAEDYALHAGLHPAVARAVHEAELPRHAGGELPRTPAGAVLSLADRLDLLAGLAATVGLPTGSSDPYALRRAAAGLVAVHRAHPDLAAIDLFDALTVAAGAQPVEVDEAPLREFLTRRLEQTLVEEGHRVDRVRAVLPHASRPAVADRLLAQLGRLVADPAFRGLAEAFQRARRIVPDGTTAGYDPARLTEAAELTLHETLVEVRAKLLTLDDASRFTDAAEPLVAPVTRFFDEVYVMSDDAAVRAARLGLLAAVRDLGEGLLDWPQLRL